MVFPDRDFVTVEGFADHVNETAPIEVVRDGVGVVGSAEGVVSGTDVAFEINHPGGYCWGAGTGLNVTPDIQSPATRCTITFGGSARSPSPPSGRDDRSTSFHRSPTTSAARP